jgi:YD repeat-containing protein
MDKPFAGKLGTGWSHSHAVYLEEQADFLIVVHLPNASEAHFTREGTSEIFAGDTGSNASITRNSSSSNRYVLTMPDGSSMTFDDQGRLIRRDWSNGEVWTYKYFPPAGTETPLEEVSDGYGRKLVFRYHAAGANAGRLFRVGDQTFNDSNPNNLTGRYIEFGYIDGIGYKLLSSVRDVRGEVWTYTYQTSVTPAETINYLLTTRSPVTTDAPNGLVIQRLTYIINTNKANSIAGLIQERGVIGTNPALLRTEMEFKSGSANTTTETMGQRTTTHRFVGALRVSVTNANGAETEVQPNVDNLRPQQQVDPNGNLTQLAWSGDGKQLNQVTDALNQSTLFTYNTNNNTLKDSTDAQGRKTTYTYGTGAASRLPTIIKVLDTNGTTVLRHQTFSYDAKGRVLT